MKKILIAGGTGFIGYHLAKKLKKFGYKITSLSLTKPKKIRKIKGVKYILCDVYSYNKLKKKINKHFDYIINLSGHVDHKNRTKVFKSHEQGLKNLVNLFKNKRIKHFIQIGSSAEYGKSNIANKESFKCKPLSVYGLAKLNATKYSISAFNAFKFPITVLRLYQAYGPYQDNNRLIPIVINSCKKNIIFNCSSGNQFRDYVYIDDVVDFILKILNNPATYGKILNLGSGKKQKIKNIILKIQKFFQSGKPNFGVIKLRKDEPKYSYPDLSKVKSLIKWKPKTSFDEGLKKTIQYYEKK